MKRIAFLGAVIAASAIGCGEETPTYDVASGLYQLSTAEISGDCKLDWSLQPGALTVGSVIPADVVASAVSIDVDVCGHPDEAPSCAGLGDSYGFGLARDDNDLVGEQLWLVPGCGMPDYLATLVVSGTVTGESAVDLTWTATITATDPNWTCNEYRPCTSTIEQRMAMAAASSRE